MRFSSRVRGGAALARPVAIGSLLVVIAACTASPAPAPTASARSAPAGTTDAAAAIPDWRVDPNEPFPFTTPAPPLDATAIDGVYTRVPTDPYRGQRAPCRRCPPYPLDRGSSTLSMDAGRYEMVHELPRYRMIGHFTVSGDRLTLFNDAECTGVVGSYTWSLRGDSLVLEVLDDRCGFGQRAKDFTAVPWTRLGPAALFDRCEPPSHEAAVTGHWPAPSGC